MKKAVIEVDMALRASYGAKTYPMVASSVKKLNKLPTHNIKIVAKTEGWPLKSLDVGIDFF